MSNRCAAMLWLACMALPAAAETAPAPLPGAEKTLKTRVLENSARWMQGDSPLQGINVYLVGLQRQRTDPTQQNETHQYCEQVNQDFAQCVLYDGNGRGARLSGVQYIISAKLYEALAPAEKPLWSPLGYAILSGQLVAPGVPAVAEKALMKDKIAAYSKTWQLWNTGGPGRSGSALPVGEAHLLDNFVRDGEASAELVRQRDQRLGIDANKKRSERQSLAPAARPAPR